MGMLLFNQDFVTYYRTIKSNKNLMIKLIHYFFSAKKTKNQIFYIKWGETWKSLKSKSLKAANKEN